MRSLYKVPAATPDRRVNKDRRAFRVQTVEASMNSHSRLCNRLCSLLQEMLSGVSALAKKDSFSALKMVS